MDACCKNNKEAEKKDEKEKEGCCAECPDKGCEGCECSKPQNTSGSVPRSLGEGGCCGGCACENR
jgi:hypothetical protein